MARSFRVVSPEDLTFSVGAEASRDAGGEMGGGQVCMSQVGLALGVLLCLVLLLSALVSAAGFYLRLTRLQNRARPAHNAAAKMYTEHVYK